MTRLFRRSISENVEDKMRKLLFFHYLTTRFLDLQVKTTVIVDASNKAFQFSRLIYLFCLTKAEN